MITAMNGFASLRSCIFALITIISIGAAQAHPGHGLSEHGFGHAISSPFHLACFLITAIMFWALAGVVRRTVLRRLLQGGAVVSLLAALLTL